MFIKLPLQYVLSVSELDTYWMISFHYTLAFSLTSWGYIYIYLFIFSWGKTWSHLAVISELLHKQERFGDYSLGSCENIPNTNGENIVGTNFRLGAKVLYTAMGRVNFREYFGLVRLHMLLPFCSAAFQMSFFFLIVWGVKTLHLGLWR